MRICVLGAGAIGGVVATRLAEAGEKPLVVDANADHVKRLRSPGLTLIGDGDRPAVPLEAHLPSDAPHGEYGPYDIVLLAVRSQHTEAALQPVLDHLDGDVVSLQNGLNEDRIADLVGSARTIGCVVGFGATWLEPGRVECTSSGGLVIGRLDGTTDPSLEAVRDRLGRILSTQTTDNILGALWGKMAVNSVTVLGALSGLLTGQVLERGPRRAVVEAVVSETVDVALADGVRLPDVLGVPTNQVAERRPSWTEELGAVLDVIAEHFGEVKSVTLRDFELGRPTEVDAVTGEIVRRGERLGVATPVNAAVLARLRDIEAGRAAPDPAHLEALPVQG